jgi:RNA polymerase sigma-70 factor (ECF subfamily)
MALAMAEVRWRGAVPDARPRESGATADADDLAAVAAIRAGDQSGLRFLHAHHGRALLSYVISLVGDPRRAEEVVQDVLVAAWRGAGGFEGRGTVRGWLFAVARRRAISAFQADPARRESGEAGLNEVVETQPGPERIAVARCELADVTNAIGRLAPHHREVLVLACVEQMTGPQISEVLGVPVGTVKSRLSLARKSLLHILAGTGRVTDEH